MSRIGFGVERFLSFFILVKSMQLNFTTKRNLLLHFSYKTNLIRVNACKHCLRSMIFFIKHFKIKKIKQV